MSGGIALSGLVGGVVALIVSQRIVWRVAVDVGRPPKKFPAWSYAVAGVVGGVTGWFSSRTTFVAALLLALVTAQLLLQAPLDLLMRRLSRPVTFIALVATVSAVIVDAIFSDTARHAVVAFATSSFVLVVHALLYRLSPRSLGWGDVLLVVPLALTIGYVAVDRLLVWQLLACTSAAVHAVILRLTRQATTIPFGPHLLIAAWLVLLASV